MFQVSSQPYQKMYTVPYASMGCFLKAVILCLAVVLPFFLTYATPNFYLNSELIVKQTQTINYNFKYHITITTDQSSYVYTNLFTYLSSRSITILQKNQKGYLAFSIEWNKQDLNELVKNVKIFLFCNYLGIGDTQHFGIIESQINGYNIGEGSIMGYATIKQGNNKNTTSEQKMTINSYDLHPTLQAILQSSNYLKFDYNALPINMPTDLLQIHLGVNYSGLKISHETPSILGQLIWSWIQYFPIFLVIYWVANQALLFFFRQSIIQNKITHDPEYIDLVRQQKKKAKNYKI